MSVENLSKLQISAVKKMAQSLTPLQNTIIRTAAKMTAYAEAKQAEFTVKMGEFQAIIARNEEEIANIELAIATYTGGVTLQEILNPEANIDASVPTPVDAIDTEATPEMVQFSPAVEEEVPAEEELPATSVSDEVEASNSFAEAMGALNEGPSI